ncbi:MAG: RadC family protein [Magnetospiraceae bacterium]
MPDKPHYHGHRKRLRERFLNAGPEALADYELLELILFGSFPRGDVKPIAKALLARFGSFAEVVNADPKDIQAVPGMGEAGATALKVVRAAALRMMQDGIMKRPVVSSWQALTDYCRASMASEKIEQFRILFLNRRNELIADEVQQTGTVDHTPVYPREVIKRALELGATALILVHNHPSGDPEPSKDDIEITREVIDAGEKMDIVVHDHVIVARGGISSFRAMGLL